jgi:hypothetical protein
MPIPPALTLIIPEGVASNPSWGPCPMETVSALYKTPIPSWTKLIVRATAEWRAQRRALHRQIHQNVVHRYHAIQTAAAHLFLQALLDDPTDLRLSIRE